MFEKKDMQPKSKKDDRGNEDRGQRGQGGKGQGQRKGKQYEDGERSEQGKWMNMFREKERKMKGIFYGGAQKRKKRGIKEIIKFREEREERQKDKKTDGHKKKNV